MSTTSSGTGALGDSSRVVDSKMSVGEYSSMDQKQEVFPKPYFSQPKQHLSLSASKRNSWNSTHGNRSPQPSPLSGRRTHTSISSPEPPIPKEEDSGFSPLSFDRDRGRGRGRGYRGRGKADVGGRFGGRGPSRVGSRLQFTPRDGAPESHFSRPRLVEGEDSKRPVVSSASDEMLTQTRNAPEIRDDGEAKPISQHVDDKQTMKPEKQQSQPDQPVSSEQQPTKLEPGASSKPDETASSASSTTLPSVKKEEEKTEEQKALEPPPVGEPSGSVKALCRLVVLKEQMEYCYARHMQLVNRHELLKVQSATLQELPVGIDAIKEDLDEFVAKQAKTEAKVEGVEAEAKVEVEESKPEIKTEEAETAMQIDEDAKDSTPS